MQQNKTAGLGVAAVLMVIASVFVTISLWVVLRRIPKNE